MAEFLLVTKRNYEQFSAEEFEQHLPEEVERARSLYAERRFRSIWARADGAGAVILVEADTELHARQIWDSLPLASRGMTAAMVIPLAAYHGFCRNY